MWFILLQLHNTVAYDTATPSHTPASLCLCLCCVLQGDLGLNIREAHVFNTTDAFALDVFVVDGWNSDVSSAGSSREAATH
jgi:hypothetical protein